MVFHINQSLKRIIIIPVLFVFSLACYSQQKNIAPRAFYNACDNQTRNENGIPGVNYWQNSSNYDIKVSIDVAEKTLSGNEQIMYYNNSPDTLNMIVIRLYQDIFKKAVNRNTLFEVDPYDVNEGVVISGLQVNNTNIIDSGDLVKREGTLLYVSLSEKLLPHTHVELNIDWQFHIPERSLIRMGTFDSTSMFLGQWYPQVAVYDDVYGWDKHSHNGLAEFYNDVNNFEVEITVPEDYLVWATGEPVNIAEVLQPEYFNRYRQATTSDNIISIITASDLEAGDITTHIHTWKFKAEQVTDFAFGLSDHYLWDASSVVVDETTQRRTVIGTAYKQGAPYFDKVAHIARETVKSLSTDMPGIPFPFPYLTVFNGDFGMEYPMITNVGAENDYAMTVYGNSHEITHSYFPFYVCTNETKSGWMDEGFTVFLPEKLQTAMVSDLDEGKRNAMVFGKYAGLEDEPAVITPTFYLDANIYFYLNYAKPDVALHMLEQELGKDVFKTCLSFFMANWKYKHPTPYDFFNAFNYYSGQNLDWFWNAWYYQQGGIADLSIQKISQKRRHCVVNITNNGDFPLPIVLAFYQGDKLVKFISKPARLWQNAANSLSIDVAISEDFSKIILGNDYIPDANQEDNVYVIE